MFRLARPQIGAAVAHLFARSLARSPARPAAQRAAASASRALACFQTLTAACCASESRRQLAPAAGTAQRDNLRHLQAAAAAALCAPPDALEAPRTKRLAAAAERNRPARAASDRLSRKAAQRCRRRCWPAAADGSLRANERKQNLFALKRFNSHLTKHAANGETFAPRQFPGRWL